MNEPAVSVKSLTKSFGTRKVVDDLSFDVQKGEVFALLGHNGAGKSTTIDLILGLKAPDGGSARILGMDAAKNRKQVFERVAYSFSIPVISPASLWRKHASSTLPCMPPRQIITDCWSNLDLTHCEKASCPSSLAGNDRSFPWCWR